MIISNFLKKIINALFFRDIQRVDFNCNDWKLNRKNRYKYIYIIIKDNLRLGFSEIEIIELLGCPDKIYKIPECTIWSYDAGQDLLQRRYSLHFCFASKRVYEIKKKQKFKNL